MENDDNEVVALIRWRAWLSKYGPAFLREYASQIQKVASISIEMEITDHVLGVSSDMGEGPSFAPDEVLFESLLGLLAAEILEKDFECAPFCEDDDAAYLLAHTRTWTRRREPG